MNIAAKRIKHKSNLLYYAGIILIIVCFFEILPHLELIISPKLRLLTPQKLIYYIGFIFIINILIKRKFNDLMGTPENIIIISFIGSLIASSLLGFNPEISLLTTTRYLGLIIFYIIIINISKSVQDIEQTLFILIMAGIIFFCIGIFLYQDLLYLSDSGFYTSLRGELIERKTIYNLNANTAGYIAAFLLIIIFFFLFKTRLKWKRFFFYYPVMVFFLYIMITTLSRGALVAFIFSLIFVSKFYRFQKNKGYLFELLFFIILSSSLLILPFSILLERITRGIISIFQIESASGYGYSPDMSYFRVEQAKMILDLLFQKPFLGWGFMSIEESFSLMPTYAQDSINHLHYLQIAFYGGFVGLLFYITFFVTILLKLLKSIKRLKMAEDQTYILGSFLWGLFLFALIKGVFAPLLYEIWLIAGLSSAFVKIEKIKQKENLRDQSSKRGFYNHLPVRF